MAKLFECDCIGTDNYCPMHGKPVDTQRKLKICPACKGSGKCYESMNEDPCHKCKQVGYLVAKKTTTRKESK